MILAEIGMPTVLALVGILVLWFTFKRLGRRPPEVSRPSASSRTASTSPGAESHTLDAPPSLARWEVSMHETARDMMGRLDTKIAIVEQLVRQAQEVTDRLEKVLDRIEQERGRLETAKPDTADRGPAAS